MLAVLALVLTPVVTHRVWGPTVYSATATLSTINRGQSVTITISITGGTASQLYNFNVILTKPSGGGVQSVGTSTTTDTTGAGTAVVMYPNNPGPPWTGSGTINTDLDGPYAVSVDKTFPNPVQTSVAATSFLVTHVLRVTIFSPTGTSYTRGETVTISAIVDDWNYQPLGSATVTSSTPRSNIALLPTLPLGTYSFQYQIQTSDPLGPWNIAVTAGWGANSGNNATLVSVQPAQLVVADLSTYNSYGSPTSDFSPGDTLYASFRVKYSPSGAFLTTGSFNIQIRNPSGGTVGNLTSVYDQNRGLFYTPSGLQVSSSDPGGSWQLVFPANSLNDTYGNSGPTTTITYRFQIRLNQSVINPIYFIIAVLAAGGVLGAILALRRFNTKTVPFEELFKLTGGEIQPPATLMIVGDAGAGATTLGLQLLHRDLVAGKPCGLLSYDSFPSEIRRKMRDMGWDITAHLEKGQLSILDCYSALAGVENAPIKDPTDFTEVSIRVTGMVEKAKGPTTILLDSVTPIFNSASAKDCINFLQVLGAKVKNSGGMFIFTATKGSVPEEARSKTESLADGVIELNLVKRAKSLARFLMVKKIPGRQISSVETEFQIATGKGVLLKKQRIPITIFRPK